MTLWGQNITAYRLEKQISHKELAKRAGIGHNTLSWMIYGNRECSVQKLMYVAEALGIPVWKLFLEVEETLDGIQDSNCGGVLR